MMLMAILSPQQRLQRFVLWAVIVSQLLLNISLSIYILTQCRPTEALWDHDIQGKCLPPEGQEYFGYVQGGESISASSDNRRIIDQISAVNSLTDLALAMFPVTIVWKLNMKLVVKISFCLTMGLGVL